MADLLDIAPSMMVAAVWINGQRIVVRGLNANDTAFIISRFPDIESLFFGGGIDKSRMAQLIKQFGASVGPIIAAGCGHLGEEKYEQAASVMVLEDQASLFAAIWGLTFRKGISSFAEKMTRLTGEAGEGAKIVKLRSKKLPSALQPSSGADSRQTLQ